MVYVLGAPPSDSTAALKLKEIHSHVRENGLADFFAAINKDQNGTHEKDLLLFCDALFSRAPDNYFRKLTINTMLSVALDSMMFYREYLETREVSQVKITRRPKSKLHPAATVINSAIVDRPFVIDTLTEIVRRHELDIYVYLHPILREVDGRNISLVYLELEPIEEGWRLDALRKDLNDAYSSLVLVTSHFPEMVQRMQDVAEALPEDVKPPKTKSELQEIYAFLRWLSDEDAFIFLGYREWISGDRTLLSRVNERNLGLFSSQQQHIQNLLDDTDKDAESLLNQKRPIHYSKILLKSPIHRLERMGLVTVRIAGAPDQPTRVCGFLGLFTSKALSQESSSLPLFSDKIKRVLEVEGLLPQSHNYKEIVSIANSLPKDDLLSYAFEHVRRELMHIFGLQRRNEIKVNIFLVSLRRFVAFNVLFPRQRYSADVRVSIQNYVESLLGVEPGESDVRVTSNEHLIGVRILVPHPSRSEVAFDHALIERKIAEFTLSWEDKLRAVLNRRCSKDKAKHLFDFYGAAFPDDYKSMAHPATAVNDLLVLESLDAENPLEIKIDTQARDYAEELYELTLYKRGSTLTLSAVLPYLENAGFDIVRERAFKVATQGAVFATIYSLSVRPSSGKDLELSLIRSQLLIGLKKVLNGVAENDTLNQLLLTEGLGYRDLIILRLLVNYLWQIKASPSKALIIDSLLLYPGVARLLKDYFFVKFDPALFPEDEDKSQRLSALSAIAEELQIKFKGVVQLHHDRALKALLNVLQASVRTNFFQLSDGDLRIAIKIECKKITRMPYPRPKFEIFVSDPIFEGVHLRGGRVARGGLRWSERAEDFRTEVLGLMNTQMVKNSIIVPVGAKGGFVVKNLPRGRDAIRSAVEGAYKLFIRSLLEITDNRVEGEVDSPPLVVKYDKDDTYLVVAADKGTATFSDIANRIAVSDFSFWLNDAFASGGSAGYDHKKYGITARGGWESVSRHFRELGKDVSTQEHTAVGIGDMSGDVFGNGLLRSDKTRLVAAFNHRHIFIDPDPDAKSSYVERERLFKLPHSSWLDYDQSLLSAGGGIYERTRKEIQLSPEACRALGTTKSEFSGEELIKAILCAPVDLLWNGGIGTYIKSTSETHLEVGDSANDDVRIDASALRVAVVGEGGNLGFTQNARIEYANSGGGIMMDAVDNSGGVALSDLEVNLKILLSQPLHRGEITMSQRNELLASWADESCEKVLVRNRTQSRSLALEVVRSRQNLSHYRVVINDLEQEGILNRQGAQLPEDNKLLKAENDGKGLTRPELAMLVAHVRMSIYARMIESSLPEQSFCNRFLKTYFPKVCVEKYLDDVLLHPLRREIIATEVANLAVELMGASFFTALSQTTGASVENILAAFLAASDIIGAAHLKFELRKLDRANLTHFHVKSLLKLQNALAGVTRWMLSNVVDFHDIESISTRYAPAFHELLLATDSILVDSDKEHQRAEVTKLITNGIGKPESEAVAAIHLSTWYLDIINISLEANTHVVEVAALYMAVAHTLQVRESIARVEALEGRVDHWEKMALMNICTEIRMNVSALVKAIIAEQHDASEQAMTAYLNSRSSSFSRYLQTVNELKNREVSLAAIVIISRQLHILSQKVL